MGYEEFSIVFEKYFQHHYIANNLSALILLTFPFIESSREYKKEKLIFSHLQDYAPKFPLLIDPDGVGYQRILEWEYDNKLVTIDMSNR
jgi:hypothetical protein